MSYTPTEQSPAPAGSLRLFAFRGINVFVHWLWAVVAIFEVRFRRDHYQNPIWNAAEYLTLFAIVLLHEFGHAFACRSVGGRAHTILLWPLGGVAYVQPPFRPGAHLWSIVAGPLVNVALVIPTVAAWLTCGALVPAENATDLHEFLFAIAVINVALLVFNLLPIYPLDGGQILLSLLWYFMAYERALTIAAWVGMFGAGAGMGLALVRRDAWLIFIALMAGMQCWRGLQLARAIRDYKRSQQMTPPRGL